MITMQGVDPNMIANNLMPLYPTHPGTVLKDEIEYRGISQRRLAGEMNIAYSTLNEILNCKRSVSAEFALLAEAALGIDADLLIDMQVKYDKTMAKRNNKFIKRLNKVRRIAAIL